VAEDEVYTFQILVQLRIIYKGGFQGKLLTGKRVNIKVQNLKTKFKRRAEIEKKRKVETTDSVNTVSSAITPVSLTRIGYNATEE